MHDPLYYEVRRMLDKTLSNGVDAAGAGATLAAIGGTIGTVAAVETGTPDGTAAIIITVLSAVAAIALNVYSVVHRSRREAAKEDVELAQRVTSETISAWKEIADNLRRDLSDCHAAHAKASERIDALEASLKGKS